MQHHARTSRRGFLAMAALAVPTHAALAQDAPPPTGVDGERVEAPAWSFRLLTLQDPYSGALHVPAEIPVGNRVVAIEIEVVNDADQALDFTPIDVRLRDADGAEHRGGAAIGNEPMINPRNLNPGERSRGWVWFVVPEETTLTEVVYIAPQPQYRVPV